MLTKRKKRRDSGTRSKVSKGPIRDPEHLARVRTLRCWICYSPSIPTEAHHIRECYPRTMGVRVGDDKVLPLCDVCHRMVHRNSRTFWTQPDVTRGTAARMYVETLSLRGKAKSKSSVALQPRREG